jgi:hypothetical protein
MERFEWWGGWCCMIAQRSEGLVRLKGIGDGDEEEVLAGAVWPLRW